MTQASSDVASSPLAAPPSAAKPVTYSLGLSAQFAMWVIVLTLCVIALSRSDVFSSWNSYSRLAPDVKAHIQAIEAKTNDAAVAAQAAASSARAAAMCAASLAAGTTRAVNCATSLTATTSGGGSAVVMSQDQLRPMADIAKMTLDASKDKFDALKEGNDKLFSVLAAMGALLTFLGFKGLDSFVAAKTKAEEAVEKAKEAVEKAKAAQEEADKATANFADFLAKAYKDQNRAEINVAQGIALREMASIYRQGWLLQNPESELPDEGKVHYKGYLKDALYYLDAALEDRASLSEGLILRTMGIQCNVHRRLDNFEMALATARQIMLISPIDESAFYNAACYCSLIGERFAKVKVTATEDWAALSLQYLAKAVELEPNNRKIAADDHDFDWVKSVQADRFKVLVFTS